MFGGLAQCLCVRNVFKWFLFEDVQFRQTLCRGGSLE